MSTFVFLHVGEEPFAEILVNSIHVTNPQARVVQVTDTKTNQVRGVTDVFRYDFDISNLMTFRLEAFAALELREPAIYLDTDMVVISELHVEEILLDSCVACCERSFGRDEFLNTQFRGMDLSEYRNRTFGDIYPILAAFTASRGNEFWRSCRDKLQKLDRKFHFWFGDQEAMRDVVFGRTYDVRLVPESVYACLPEMARDYTPRVLHFKGAKRKASMLSVGEALRSRG